MESCQVRSRLEIQGGYTAETLRLWARQTETDQGKRDGMSSSDRERLKRLESENRKLKETNEILRKTSVFVAQVELGGSGDVT